MWSELHVQEVLMTLRISMDLRSQKSLDKGLVGIKWT